MAQDKKISELDAASPLDLADLIVVVQSGTTYRGTVSDFLTFIQTQDVSFLGHFSLGTAGKLFTVRAGTNQRAGNATLVAGTVAVSNSTVTANSIILLTRKTSGGVVGELTYTVSAGASFTINSSSALDTSTVSYFIFELA